jgi:hypothetical protein
VALEIEGHPIIIEQRIVYIEEEDEIAIHAAFSIRRRAKNLRISASSGHDGAGFHVADYLCASKS